MFFKQHPSYQEFQMLNDIVKRQQREIEGLKLSIEDLKLTLKDCKEELIEMKKGYPYHGMLKKKEDI